jgi:surface carbohydrate biosynthesis protein
MKNIIFPIEIKKREFYAKVFLTHYLLSTENNKVSIYIGDYKKIRSVITLCSDEGSVILLNGISCYDSFYSRLKDFNASPHLLQEEGNIFTSNLLKLFKDADVFNYIRFIDKIYLWSKSSKDLWKNFIKSDHDEKKFVVTGHPRFDLPKLASFQEKRKYILINTTFAVVNSLVDVASEVENSVFLKKHLVRHNQKFSGDSLNRDQKLLIKFISGIEKLLQHFPNERFLLRPHPGENPEFYKKYFNKYSNIKISENTTLTEVLNEVKFIIHPGCTTAVEAAMQKIISICYCPLLDRRNIQVLPFMISYKCKDESKLVNLCEGILKKNIIFKEKKNLIKKYIDNYSYYSAEKISTEIINYKLPKKTSPIYAKVKWTLLDAFFKIRYYPIYIYKYFFYKKFRETIRQQKIRELYKIPYIKEQEIIDLLEKYKLIFKKKYNYKIINLKKNFFKIEKI